VTRALAAAALVLAAPLGALLGVRGSEADHARPALVRVSVDAAPRPPALATGVVVASRRVLTVAHVLHAGGAVTVATPGARPRAARVVAVDERTDLALLAVEGLSSAPLRLDAEPLPAGSVVTVARLEAVERSTHARPAALRMDGHTERAGLVVAVDIAAGDSGAPVLRDDRVVGVLFASSRERPDTAYAVAAGEVAAVLRQGALGLRTYTPRDTERGGR
jgi:S1-C subfamily serine protease